MKKFIVIALLASSITGWTQTNQKRHKIESSGYGAVTTSYSKFNGDDAVLVGAYGGWLINHRLLIGLGANVLVTQHDGYNMESLQSSAQNNLWMGYGGLVVEYKLFQRKNFSVTSNVLIGAGAVVNGYKDDFHHDNGENWHSEEESGFRVLQPSVNIEYAFTDWFHVAVGGGYRYITGADMKGISNKDMSAPMANLSFKFGVF